MLAPEATRRRPGAPGRSNPRRSVGCLQARLGAGAGGAASRMRAGRQVRRVGTRRASPGGETRPGYRCFAVTYAATSVATMRTNSLAPNHRWLRNPRPPCECLRPHDTIASCGQPGPSAAVMPARNPGTRSLLRLHPPHHASTRGWSCRRAGHDAGRRSAATTIPAVRPGLRRTSSSCPSDGFIQAEAREAGHGFDQPPTEPRASRERDVFDRAREGGHEGSSVVGTVAESGRGRHASISLLRYELWYDFNKLLFLVNFWRRGRDSNPRYAINVHTLSRRAP